MNIKTVASKIT